MKTLKSRTAILFVLFALLMLAAAPQPQAVNTDPPDEVVKLVFIHHSTGAHWLKDDHGELGRTLGENNYFVSDTNYSWGPNAIGDRTDIPNWTEWFASADTPTYMEALFNETGQNTDSYTRTLADPGGENEIIMFKSCFPNSLLEGSPDDPPGTYEELSVSGAKYVYNTILPFFASHPEKLFVVITAPPLTGVKGWWYADNARAFNQWLLNDWLRENNYTLNNVAVFDFYNILTDPNAHHRISNGQIEHVIADSNTLYYPTADGDDHPSVEGSQKATEEFVPMLNAFYHRWKENAPLQAAPASEADATPQAQEAPQPESSAMVSGVIDSFDAGPVAGTSGWEAFRDEATSTAMACGSNPGTGRDGASLQLDFDIAANSWGTCALMYQNPQNWSAGQGLVFYYRTAKPGTIFDIDLYAGPSENRETYVYTVESSDESVNDWVMMELRWEDFHRAAWEENAGAAFAKPEQVTGMAFGAGTPPDAPNTSTVWVDDLALLGTVTVEAPQEAAPPTGEQAATPTEQAKKPSLPCTGALILPMSVMLGLAFLGRKR